jgi:hypothetical protein
MERIKNIEKNDIKEMKINRTRNCAKKSIRTIERNENKEINTREK